MSLRGSPTPALSVTSARALAPVRRPRPSGAGWSRVRLRAALIHGDLGLFVGVLTLNLLLAVVVIDVWRVLNIDAYARTANAYYVLYSRDPHLAAIGFVWPPLPSLLMLPLLPVLKPLGLLLYAPAIVTAVLAAGGVVCLRRILALFALPPRWQGVFLAAWFLSPLTWFFAANGLTQMAFTGLLLFALYQQVQWERGQGSMALAGVALAAGFLVRYETAALTALLVVLVYARSVRREGSFSTAGTAVALGAPTAYVVLLWLFFNFLVMGDPLHFLNSPFATANSLDVARMVGPANAFLAAMHDPLQTIYWSAVRMGQAALPFLVAAPLLAWRAWRHGDGLALTLLVIGGAIPLVQAAQVYQGTLPPYLRNWSHPLPIAVVALAYLAYCYRDTWPAHRARLAALLVVALGSLVTWGSLRDDTLGKDEQLLFAHLFQPGTVATGAYAAAGLPVFGQTAFDVQLDDRIRPIVRTLDERLGKDDVALIDASTSMGIILSVAHPKRLASTSDRDYEELVFHPFTNGVTYILVGEPFLVETQRNLITYVYPDLWATGEDFAVLVAEFPDHPSHFRLYRVVGTPGEGAVPRAEGRDSPVTEQAFLAQASREGA